MRRSIGCAAAAVLALAATVLPWSSTAAAGRNGWETASLALALDEAVHRPVLTVLACTWYALPLAAALALVLCSLLPRRSAALALRAVGVLIVLVVLAVLVALGQAGPDVSLLGPLLSLVAGAALVALPPPTPTQSTRRTRVAAPGAPS